MDEPHCVFCDIIAHKLPASIVYEDEHSIAFLDSRPLFPGHVLLCPRTHYETLLDVPEHLNGTILSRTQLVARAVEAAVDAEGTFIAVNNRVSQTVPHLHIHVIPRRRRDGLKGFFWPRQNYKDDQAREAVRNGIEHEIEKLLREH